MYIKNILINNFRNYSKLDLSFEKPINLFFGNNAEGKTNLLEAIYYLATGKSHRTQNVKELIKWDRDLFYLKSEIIKKSTEVKLELGYNLNNNKKVKINGVEKNEFSKMGLNVVMFSPEDLMLIKGSPENRRRFLNLEISQTDNAYAYHLYHYNKTLRQRNKFLKEKAINYKNYNNLKDQLYIWDKQLAEHGVKILIKRKDIIHKLGILSKLNSRKISEGQEVLELSYLSTIDLDESDGNGNNKDLEFYYLDLLQKKEQIDKDVYKKITTIGPHRDDLLFKINNKEAKKFGSQGQIRTIVLSLKIAELELIKSEIGEYPVLLLDDVLSELDVKRRRHLLEISKNKVQTFITGTKKEDFMNEILNSAQIFKVKDGEIYT
ncbi:DNA replication/repair protein RecF [Natranaerofaba carboxydovora]|uniref:DNA replication/repair protein RecF n=1 Tax=Natranaerofaba carboxydovora TaxID=2742683 RepID=UPI001F130A18|nr:DNA replication/repair protein RecF [Natranaerofaba carboxydovora]UMZ75190.1 DNA replication and repair protein RecF [Natranaerofaba carboxydovora]